MINKETVLFTLIDAIFHHRKTYTRQLMLVKGNAISFRGIKFFTGNLALLFLTFKIHDPKLNICSQAQYMLQSSIYAPKLIYFQAQFLVILAIGKTPMDFEELLRKVVG